MIGDEFVQLIKTAAVDAVGQTAPVEIIYGYVDKVVRKEEKPFELITFTVRVQSNLPSLGPEFFTPIGEIYVSEGSTWILAKVQGGSGYIVLGQKGVFD